MSGEIILPTLTVTIIVSVIMSIFLFLRCIPRFKNWRDGEKDELWIFISFISGGAAALLIGSGLAGFMVIYALEGEPTGRLILIGLIVGLASIGLGTVYYIFKWVHTD